MRYLTVVALVAAVLAVGVRADASIKPAHACRFQKRQTGTWTTDEVKWTARCLAERMNVSVHMALYVGHRESRWHRFAWNRASDCRGVYQHKYAYWWSRVRTHARKLRKYAVEDRNWFSPRAQAVVTFAMVKQGGWGPWGG